MVSLVLAAGLLAAAPARAGVEIFDEVIVAKGIERENGAVVDATPYFFEFCLAGPDISESTLPTLQTPASTNFPGGSMQTLTKEYDGDEFCFEQFYASSAAREADFPNGSYTVSATNVAGSATDTKQVSFTATEPTAYPGFTAPPNGGTVSTSDPTSVSWSLVDKGGCNTSMPASCLEFFVVGTFVADKGGSEVEVDFQIIMDPSATGTSIPSTAFTPGTSYSIEVESLRGSLTDETTDTLGQDVQVIQVSTDINAIQVTAEQAAQPINEVFMFKGLDRNDGVLIADPYFIEICVMGADIPTAPENALPTVQTPPSTNFPAGSTEVMTPYAGGSEFCFEAEGFADGAALEASYPSGSYTVTVTDNAMSTDTAIVSYDLAEPSGFPDLFAPMDGAMVPADENLDIQWGDLTAKNMSCDPMTPASCADGILVFVIDESIDEDVDVQQLPNTAGAATIDASLLEAGTQYGLEVESFRGSAFEEATSNTLGNPIRLTRLYEDINSIAVTAVPEPVAAAMQLAALSVLTWVARRRRRAD